ncbi:MAG: tetratricopeptide repeat protein [Phycisphaerales bacterium]
MTNFPPALAEAYKAQQTGRLDEAERLYLDVLREDPDNADALHLFGLLSGQLGREDAAIESIRRAIQVNDGHPAYHYSLGRALAGRGDMAEAEAEFRRAIEIHEPLAPAHLELGLVLDRMDRPDEALRSFEAAVQHKPDYSAAYFHAGNILRRSGQGDAALQSYRRAIELDANNVEASLNLALLLREAGKLEESEQTLRALAERRSDFIPARSTLGAVLLDMGRAPDALEVLQAAEAVAPDDPKVLHNLGSSLTAVGRSDEAVGKFRRAIEVDPEYDQAYAGLGTALRAAHDLDAAIESFRKAVELRPDSAQALFSLADVLDRVHRGDEAGPLLDKALSINPRHAMGNVLKARLDRRGGNAEAARDRLASIIDDPAYAAAESNVATELGHTFEALEAYQDAFAAFSRAQQSVVRTDQFKRFPLEAYPATVDACRERITEDLVATWETEPPADGRSAPVLFVGFPRSGTTLMEQIMEAHPDIRTTGERPVLNKVIAAVAEMTGGYRGYPEDLDDLTDDDVESLRTLYWEEMDRIVGVTGDASTYVDKQPLNIVHLPTVRRVFPEAPVVVALRDPRAVVWSCFIQEFVLNQAMVHFCSLDTASALYERVMGLWLHYRDVLGLSAIEYRYEDLVESTERVARRVLEHIGVDWDPAVLQYHERARDRVITTPSFRDVTQPVYGRAVARWRHYESLMSEEVLERLQPFVREFGYE